MKPLQLVHFFLDDRRYALYLRVVERIIPAVEITPLPKAPKIVLGLVNIEGQIIPVLNIRTRFHLPNREIDPGDHFIIASTSRRTVALSADAVEGVIEISEREVTAAADILPALEYLDGVVKLGDGMLLIHDLDRFLSLEEESGLDEALSEAREQ